MKIKKIYTICSPDSKWQAAVLPENGADIIKLQYCGRDVYHSIEVGDIPDSNPFLHGSPILIPANRTYKGEFWFEGKKYSIPINEEFTDSNLHGAVYKQGFRVLRHSGDEIELLFENCGEVYPFPFSLKVCYKAFNDRFYQHYTVKNTGDGNMPLTFALHTSFSEPDSFSVPIDCCLEKTETHIPTGRYVPLNEQERGYLANARSKGVTVSGYYKASGHTATADGFTYTVSENFDHWVLFNGRGEIGVLCIEPQCGKVNGLNLPDGYKVLKPNESIGFYTEMSLLTK